MKYGKIADEKLNTFEVNLSELLSAVRRDMREDDSKSVKDLSDEMLVFFRGLERADSSQKYIRIYSGKNRDDYADVLGIEGFKVWLISKQNDERFSYLLGFLRNYCKAKRIPLSNLNIVFGNFIDESIYNTDMYFNNKYENAWFENPEIQRMIKSVDKSEVINANSINSPVFGIIPPTKLSGGAKTLMLIYNKPDMIFNASTCGDNCARWITKFSKEKDFIINLQHVMKFSNHGFQAYIVNNGTIAHSLDELYVAEEKYCRGNQ